MAFTGNPFSKEVLKFPVGHKEQVKNYVQSGHSIKNCEDYLAYPFKRQLDFWALALSMGYRYSIFDETSVLDRFIDAGTVLGGENRLNCLIFAIAIAKDEDPYITRDPSKCIDIANKYAAGGTPLLLEWLQNGTPDPTNYLSLKIRAIIEEG